jgi:hypothetical protein
MSTNTLLPPSLTDTLTGVPSGLSLMDLCSKRRMAIVAALASMNAIGELPSRFRCTRD